MRRVLIAAIALVVALSCAATARPAATFVIKGKGWGHGLGLAQYGAYGYARDAGPRLPLDPRPLLHRHDPRRCRGRPCARPRRERGQPGHGRVGGRVHGHGREREDVRRSTPGRRRSARASRFAPRTGSCGRSPGPLRFNPGTAALRLSGSGYRGMLRVRAQSGLVSAVNDVGLEQYIKGVVPWEMPASWHPEALKAQAVVARTYGLVSRKTGQWFDLYDDTRSQVYGGMQAEDSRASAAVDATRGEVVRSGGALAWTVYHSTSGGKTASREDEWGPPGHPVPGRRGRRLRLDLARTTPGGRPTRRTTAPTAAATASGRAAALKRALGSRAPSPITDFVVSQRNSSSRVAQARLSGPSGSTTVTGGDAPLRPRPPLDLVHDRRPAAERRRDASGRARRRRCACSPAT